MLKRALSVVVGGVVLAGVAGPAGPALGQTAAYPTVDRPAALIVFPKVVYSSAKGIDTVIQLSNAEGALAAPCPSCEPTLVHCLYTWSGQRGQREQRCEERDFWFRLTQGMPIGWRVSEGLPSWSQGSGDPDRQGDGNVLPVPSDPFLGELKCYVAESQETGAPAPRNNLMGAATIYHFLPDQALDVSSYNGIGFRAVNETAFTDNTLCLGGDPGSATCPVAEFAGCSAQLMLDHRFDVLPNAPVDNSSLLTSLTLVPCSENLEAQLTPYRSLQLLVYNEFEQRFSLSTIFGCRLDTALRDLSQLSGPVFTAAVQGTVAGQTRMRGVALTATDSTRAEVGVGLIGIATETRTDEAGTVGSADWHLAMQGAATVPDEVYVAKDFLTTPPLPQ